MKDKNKQIIKNKNVLVIGDWIVDENWIVTKEFSETSSHVGKQQYRSKINGDAQLFSLCAAGTVARLLHSLSTEKVKVNIFGMGFWEPDDTHYLAALFRSDCSIHNQTPHYLKWMDTIVKLDDNIKTNPLCHKSDRQDCLHCTKTKEIIDIESENSNNKSKEVKRSCLRLFSFSENGNGTYRNLRVYSQTGIQQTHLMHRYDWCNEIPDIKKIESNIKKAFRRIDEVLKDEDFDIVVVVDHKKGGISKEILEQIKYEDKIKQAKWYVRTKDPNSDWIKVIEDKMNLLVTGPMFLDSETGPWFLGPHLSYNSMHWLCEKSGAEIEEVAPVKFSNKPKYAIVGFHDSNEFAAIIPENLYTQELQTQIDDQDSMKSLTNFIEPSDAAIILTTKAPPSPPYKGGRTSVLFSSLIGAFENLFASRINENEFRISKNDILNALEHSYHYCIKNAEDLNMQPYTKNTELNFRKNYQTALNEENSIINFQVHSSPFLREYDGWLQSRNIKEFGLVGIRSHPRINLVPDIKFQIWRGWSPIKGYITVNNEKVNSIIKLIKAVNSFVKSSEQNRSLSCLITGKPGWGKSYLIESMARYLNLEYLEFNVTQIASLDDLMACFDTISSVQTRKPDKTLMIFWDEINTKINNEHVYSCFLGPIWNGTYRRGGQSFQLKPCIWVFAGTQNPDAESKSKGSDFNSRINGPIIDLINDKTNKNDENRLEQIYMAVSILNKHFPDVTVITQSVLRFFCDIQPKFGTRSLEFIISKFKVYNHDTMGYRSLPKFDDFKTWVNNKQFFMKKYEKDDIIKARIYPEPPQ